MTSRSRVLVGVVAAVAGFSCVRVAFWPAQLAHTPYRDATVGSDLISQFFTDIPTAAWVIGVVVAVLAFFVVIRWTVRKKSPLPHSA